MKPHGNVTDELKINKMNKDFVKDEVSLKLIWLGYSSDFHGRLISIRFTCSHPDCTKDKVPEGVDILE